MKMLNHAIEDAAAFADFTDRLYWTSGDAQFLKDGNHDRRVFAVSQRRLGENRATVQMTQHTPYQLTPTASKGNAFCWFTWPGQIAWRGTKDELEAQNKRNQIIEAKRAAGIDPGHLHGLGGDTERAPARFAVGRNGHSPWHKSGIAR